MTYQEKLEAVKAKIVEAVPEIMELKFGCKFEFTNQIMVILGTRDNKTYLYCRNDLKNGLFPLLVSIEELESNRLIEIIGSDITLEDVLMTLQRTYHNSSTEVDWQLIVRKWVMGKPLHDQSKETINLLHEILCLDIKFYTREFINYSGSEEAKKVKEEMATAIVKGGYITLEELNHRLSYSINFLNVVLPLYSKIDNKKYIIK